MGDGVANGEGVGEAVSVGDGEGVAVGLELGDSVGLADDEGLGDGDELGLAEAEAVGEGVLVALGLEVTVVWGPAGILLWTSTGVGVDMALKTPGFSEGVGILSAEDGEIFWKRKIPPPKIATTNKIISPAVTNSPLTKKFFSLTLGSILRIVPDYKDSNG